jgi:hypothetical protein
MSPIPVSGRFANPVSSFGKANEISGKTISGKTENHRRRRLHHGASHFGTNCHQQVTKLNNFLM